jgi:Zn finger protein HypA/HybF involved in hydrogenase expression
MHELGIANSVLEAVQKEVEQRPAPPVQNEFQVGQLVPIKIMGSR